WIIALVAAGDAAEATVCRTGVGQVPGDDGEPVIHPVPPEMVILRWVVRRVAAMERQRPRPLSQVDAVIVIEPEAVAAEDREARQDGGRVQQTAERLAPAQEAAEAAFAALQAWLRQRLLVDPPVQRAHLIRRQDIFQDQVSLQIEQILLAIVHSASSP